ncbi:class F sortase [Arthrobacter sp. NEB 688]|uniref:class F sortase n=1 Tax=Arthrobacter sp. NEB 688 TaxID=904039 RepID=UPI001564188D|nr:class F sortase [Arthrobacter sp. NEB 688]
MTPDTTPVTSALVVVPTYDERESVERAVTRVLAADPRTEVLVVDDGSPDGTADLVAALAADEPRLHLLRRSGKGGLGSAYRAGFAWALERRYDAVVEMDADLSHPATRLPALLDGLADADLVIGSRWVDGGATHGWPLSRQLLSRGGNLYVRIALGLGVGDATAGFRAFRRAALETIDPTSLVSEGYAFQIESTYVARRLGLRLLEVPITFTERAEGTSKMSGRIVLEALLRVTGWAVGIGRPPAARRRAVLARGGSVPAVRPLAKVAAVLAALALVGGVALAARAATHPEPASLAPLPARSAAPVPASPSPDATPSGAGDAAGGDEARDAGSNDASIPVPAAGSDTPAAQQPVAIRIPAIGVESRLIDLGIAKDGTMQVPTDPALAGWLTGAPAPGERGPAVIAGHVDTHEGPAVFYRLRQLEPGDAIEVERRDGTTVTFTVRRLETFAKDDFPTDRVYGPAPGPVLRLITCSGDIDPVTGHYVDNTVVFAS